MTLPKSISKPRPKMFWCFGKQTKLYSLANSICWQGPATSKCPRVIAGCFATLPQRGGGLADRCFHDPPWPMTGHNGSLPIYTLAPWQGLGDRLSHCRWVVQGQCPLMIIWGGLRPPDTEVALTVVATHPGSECWSLHIRKWQKWLWRYTSPFWKTQSFTQSVLSDPIPIGPYTCCCSLFQWPCGGSPLHLDLVLIWLISYLSFALYLDAPFHVPYPMFY